MNKGIMVAIGLGVLGLVGFSILKIRNAHKKNEAYKPLEPVTGEFLEAVVDMYTDKIAAMDNYVTFHGTTPVDDPVYLEAIQKLNKKESALKEKYPGLFNCISFVSREKVNASNEEANNLGYYTYPAGYNPLIQSIKDVPLNYGSIDIDTVPEDLKEFAKIVNKLSDETWRVMHLLSKGFARLLTPKGEDALKDHIANAKNLVKQLP